LQVLLAKHEVTSIDLKCCDRHAEIQKYRVSYRKISFLIIRFYYRAMKQKSDMLQGCNQGFFRQTKPMGGYILPLLIEIGVRYLKI
jgi:hypothetical protein